MYAQKSNPSWFITIWIRFRTYTKAMNSKNFTIGLVELLEEVVYGFGELAV